MTTNRIVENIDDGEVSDESVEYQFDLTFYGADYPVDGLVKRLENQDIVVPSFDPGHHLATDVEAFQRKFVWSKLQCDRFVESLLLGFPVPGIFLVQQNNKRLLVLDGQQRLLTLAAFYNGILNKKEFVLENVQPEYIGLTYKTLDEETRRTLDDAIIHATVIRKTKNAQDLASVYSLFERLNSGGTQLSPHEIRVALAPGPLMYLIRDMNSISAWRNVFGAPSKTLKDQELILRFLAMRFGAQTYKSPMKDFLTKYAQYNSQLTHQSEAVVRDAFVSSIDLISQALGNRAFRIGKAFNVAVFESVMVGVSTRLGSGKGFTLGEFEALYQELLSDNSYLAAVSKATAREDQVAFRINSAIEMFAR